MHNQAREIADAHEEYAGEQDHGGRFYFLTWLWLLILTVIEVGLVAANPQRAVLVVGLLAMTLLKAGLIVANFMHVRFEKLNMLYVVLTPFVLALVLFVGIVTDFARSLGLR